ncbi:MAG: PadR family transcriptional regulator [Candidatus Dormibacteria bacterium]
MSNSPSGAGRRGLPGSGEVTRLTLLALLAALGPRHGYGLREVMESWRMDAWADIRYGSIYQMLPRMARAGLVAEVDHHREGRRPARTTYAITDSGRAELHLLLRHAWSSPVHEVQPVNVALSFYGLGLLGAEEVGDCLARRLAWLEVGATQLEGEQARTLAMCSDPADARRLTDHFDHFRRLIDLERGWTRQVLDHVRSGAYAAAEPQVASAQAAGRRAATGLPA